MDYRLLRCDTVLKTIVKKIRCSRVSIVWTRIKTVNLVAGIVTHRLKQPCM